MTEPKQPENPAPSNGTPGKNPDPAGQSHAPNGIPPGAGADATAVPGKGRQESETV